MYAVSVETGLGKARLREEGFRMGSIYIIGLAVICLVIVYAIIRAITSKPRLPQINANLSKRYVHYKQGVTDSSVDVGRLDGDTQTFRSLAEMPYELQRNVGEALHGKPVEGQAAIDPELARKDFAARQVRKPGDDT